MEDVICFVAVLYAQGVVWAFNNPIEFLLGALLVFAVIAGSVPVSHRA